MASRLASPTKTDTIDQVDVRGPRFAAWLTTAVLVVALLVSSVSLGAVGFATGLGTLGLIATGFALVAAFLNAAFAICLGCQLYPLVARLRRSRVPA